MEDSLNNEQRKIWDVIIVGAGPAGLFSALGATGMSALNQKKVLILEKMPKPARKLLISGSGRCNLTHAGNICDFFTRYGRGKEQFVKPALMNFSNTALLAFLKTRGLTCVELNDGKLFPSSERARDVLNTLREACDDFHIRIETEHDVKGIQFHPETQLFHVTALRECLSEALFYGRKVILTVGGKSYPTTGSTGDGVALAHGLGHACTPLKPALTPANIRHYSFSSCAGIALQDAHITLCRNDKKIVTNIGDVLFTHHGVSGPGILDMSRNFLPGDVLYLAPAKTYYLQDATLAGLLQQNPQRELGNLLRTAFDLPDRFVTALLASGGAYPNNATKLRAWEVTKKTRNTILQLLTRFPLTIQSVGGFREAMATAGGVSLAEVNRQTMESRLVPGLYFAGEVLDIDGDTGGFNLQFAFSSGVLAGQNAVKGLHQKP